MGHDKQTAALIFAKLNATRLWLLFTEALCHGVTISEADPALDKSGPEG